MAKSWVGHNNKVFQKAITEHRAKLEKKLQKMCQELADEVRLFIENFDSIPDMPFWSANLADGTGLGVYVNGTLRAFAPTQQATSPQSDNFTNTYDIWGFQYLQDALSESTTTYSQGIWVVLFSTVPYAIRVDEEGTYRVGGATPPDFFSNRLKEEILDRFKTAFAREFPNIAKQLTSI